MSKARELAELSRTVSDSADAVAITIDANENVTFAGGIDVTGSVVADDLIKVQNAAGSAAAEVDIVSGGTWRFRSNPTSGTNNYGLDIVKGSAGTDVKFSIDQNGNALVGKTSTAFGTAGLRFASTGAIDATVSGDGSLFLNRLSDQGPMAYFYQDSTNRGIIGTVANDLFVASADSGHNGLRFHADGILPTNNAGAIVDADADLGHPSYRFKDLYLSGNLGLGSTSPATKLDVNGGLHGDHATFTSVAGRGLKISTESRDGQNDGIGVLDAQDTEGSKGIISLQSGGTETARVTTSQILIGQTSGSAADEGVILQKTGEAFVTNDGDTALYCRRKTNNGEIVRFSKNATTVGSIGVNNTALFISSPTGNDSGIKFGDRQLVPCTTAGAARDDAINLGSSSNRFDTVYAKAGSINTSDRNEKQDIELLSDAEMRVAKAAKGLLRKYRWKSSVAEKGDDARIHFGIIAQDLQAAFEAEGLDSARYGMWCSDTFWVDSEGETYDTQEEAPEGATEQTRLGVRYSELLAFIISVI